VIYVHCNRFIFKQIVFSNVPQEARGGKDNEVGTGILSGASCILLLAMLVVSIRGYFGIQTTSFSAMLAGVGMAIGAAWSGMLGSGTR
jgi:small conductance mechanosensitive channel